MKCASSMIPISSVQKRLKPVLVQSCEHLVFHSVNGHNLQFLYFEFSNNTATEFFFLSCYDVGLPVITFVLSSNFVVDTRILFYLLISLRRLTSSVPYLSYAQLVMFKQSAILSKMLVNSEYVDSLQLQCYCDCEH